MLKRFVVEHGEFGCCDFCDEPAASTVSPRELRELFDPVVRFFEEAQEGEHFYSESGPPADQSDLVEAIELDVGWIVFNDNCDQDTKICLLDSIMEDSGYRPGDEEFSSRGFWVRVDSSFNAPTAGDLWCEFVKYIRHTRRYIHSECVPCDPAGWLPSLLKKSELIVDPTTEFYRARAGCKIEGFRKAVWPIAEMTAPPSELATRGRANPAGIPYLYLANDAETAAAEIRPYVGQDVSIRRALPKRELKLADLTRPYYLASPFGIPNLDAEMWNAGLLRKLGAELSKPVDPNASEVAYVPIQYVAEVIRNDGYDGILYKSAITAKGVNAVFFCPDELELATGGEIVTVKSMGITLERPWRPRLVDSMGVDPTA